MESITLESVEQAFCDWRAQRSNRAELIPKNLWRMALKLYPQHKRTIICRRLRLSGGQFKRHLEYVNHTGFHDDFVLASRDFVKENSNSSSEIQLTVQGKERTLMFSVNMHSLGLILYVSPMNFR